jgi:hypothetical protein
LTRQGVTGGSAHASKGRPKTGNPVKSVRRKTMAKTTTKTGPNEDTPSVLDRALDYRRGGLQIRSIAVNRDGSADVTILRTADRAFVTTRVAATEPHVAQRLDEAADRLPLLAHRRRRAKLSNRASFSFTGPLESRRTRK